MAQGISKIQVRGDFQTSLERSECLKPRSPSCDPLASGLCAVTKSAMSPSVTSVFRRLDVYARTGLAYLSKWT